MSSRFRTALIGLGRIGLDYADDPLTARHYRYATHAQVLAAHPAFEWGAAVDTNPAALDAARTRWGIRHCANTVEEIVASYEPEIVVLATPPSVRSQAIESCRRLKGVICEKPLATSISGASQFLELCASRGTVVQVNFWRRCDSLMRSLAAGRLDELVGRPQALHGVYGNGLSNNGSHVVDLCRMLFGEIAEVRLLGAPRFSTALPLADDFDVGLMLRFESELTAVLQPLDFRHYREVGLEIWGERGRLDIMSEGLVTQAYRQVPNRALTGASEIATDAPMSLPSTVGDALYNVYDNLAAALAGGTGLLSPGTSALRTAMVIETIRDAARANDQAPRPIRSVSG